MSIIFMIDIDVFGLSSDDPVAVSDPEFSGNRSMTKICLIGAGSTVFAQNILSDVLSNPELADSEISLHDIDGERLRTSEVVARRIGDALKLDRLRVSATTDRRKALSD